MRLVDLGLVSSRARAQAEIAAGTVFVNGRKIRKPSEKVGAADPVELRGLENPWVSRGGLKLAHALETFSIDPKGLACLDIGVSTGGFTEVLLSRGAAHVTAIDVGHGQLHPSLAGDARITHLEGLNAKDLMAEQLREAPMLIVCDVSFVSLKIALTPALSLAPVGAKLCALIKPQFEAGPKAAIKGVVRDPCVHEAVCQSVRSWVEGEGWRVLGLAPSPIAGGDGNREFLIAAEKGLQTP